MAKGSRTTSNGDTEALLAEDTVSRWNRAKPSSILDCYSFLKFTVIALLVLALINALPYLQWNRTCADSLERASAIEKGSQSDILQPINERLTAAEHRINETLEQFVRRIESSKTENSAASAKIPVGGDGTANINSNRIADEVPFYQRDPSTKHLDCARILRNDTAYIQEMRKTRVSYKDPDELPMDCDSIRKRSYFPSQPLSHEELAFPVAYARIVYKDYRFLEMELAAAYQPQNYYCYAIDAKADPKFHDRIHSLSRCFPNVMFTMHEFRVDSGGHNMGPSFLECLRLLAQKNMPWKYVSLLQNHDSTLRTNYEAINIFKWLNGSNDLEVKSPPGGRIDGKLDWSFKALNLFRNESRNTENHKGVPPVLKFSKGYVESSLSRPMVDFMLYDMNLTELVNRIEKGSFGIDEIMLPTLHASDAVGAPGGFTQYCQNKGISVQHITRMSLWYDSNKCGSHNMRHSICVFGIEDIPLWLAHLPHLFGNKMMPDFDFGAVDCWYETVFNRTYVEPRTLQRLNANYYFSLAHVRYQHLKAEAHGAPLNMTDFNCKRPGFDMR